MIRTPNPRILQVQMSRLLRPKTKLGRTTLWFGGLTGILELCRWAFRSPDGSMLSGWAGLVSFVFFICCSLMGLRWVRVRVMWRLRNRLIITYVFMGVIPIILLLTMFAIAGFLFSGQFAAYIATSDLQSQLQHLRSANDALAVQLLELQRQGRLTGQEATEIEGGPKAEFSEFTATVWKNGQVFVLPQQRAAAEPVALPPAIKGDFSEFVIDGNRLAMRAVRHLGEGPRRLTVISSVPVTTSVLEHATAQLGKVTIYPPDPETSSTPGKKAGGKASTTRKDLEKEKNGITLKFGSGAQTHYTIGTNDNPNALRPVEAGYLPPPSNRFDFVFPFGTRFATVNWQDGKSIDGLLFVDTRPSLLYRRLFSTLGENAGIFLEVLLGIGIFLGLIELIAFIIGVRLTRSMTRSVADLYDATQKANRGDFSHQIQVRSRDQMAALEQSFNSMMRSLASLIEEQKEKQRLESELVIAHEVQALLFPRQLSEINSLEVQGVCRPARTVSGDYYDFIPLSRDRIVLAVGDISGKGISAALLMATVHAFVRAYSLEPEQAVALPVAVGAAVNGLPWPYFSDREPCDSKVSPGALMATLNYQLYRSTPPEKYATMFLGCYDAANRLLTYSNAGHLPPIMVSADGSVTRLETSGTVVGLFDRMSYDESVFPMHPGDIFVAFSDGITEPENEFGEFGEGRLIELIREHRDQPLARISEIVTGAVADWIAGSEQPDDVTLVLARAR